MLWERSSSLINSSAMNLFRIRNHILLYIREYYDLRLSLARESRYIPSLLPHGVERRKIQVAARHGDPGSHPVVQLGRGRAPPGADLSSLEKTAGFYEPQEWFLFSCFHFLKLGVFLDSEKITSFALPRGNCRMFNYELCIRVQIFSFSCIPL